MEYRYKLKKINKKPMAYSACLKAGRKSLIKKFLARKPPYKLLPITTKKPRDSKD